MQHGTPACGRSTPSARPPPPPYAALYQIPHDGSKTGQADNVPGRVKVNEQRCCAVVLQRRLQPVMVHLRYRRRNDHGAAAAGGRQYAAPLSPGAGDVADAGDAKAADGSSRHKCGGAAFHGEVACRRWGN